MNFSWCLTQVTSYWPVVAVLIMAVIVSLVIIYTKVSSDPVLVYFYGETVKIINSSRNAVSPQIAASGDNLYVVWADKSTGYGDINLKKITNNNTIFNSTINLSNNNGNSTDPEIAASGDNVYVVWADNSGGKDGNGDVFFSSSKDNRISFDELTNLSNNNGNSTNPEISTSGNNVYVLWSDSLSTKTEINYKHIGLIALE